MAFRIIDNPTFTHKVSIRVPVDGGFETQSVDCTYKVIPADQLETYDLAMGKGTKDFLTDAIEKLGDVVGENGEPLTYNDALRDRLLTLPYVRAGLVQGYYEGVTAGRLGN